MQPFHWLIGASLLTQLFGLWQSPPRPTLPPVPAAVYHQRVCDVPAAGAAACQARVRTDAGNKPLTTVLPNGLGPAQLHAAYQTPTTAAGPAPTIAVITAYDDARIKADLDTYNATFGLPAFANCSATVTTGCFQKVSQRGDQWVPFWSNAGWSLETALDVETAHQTCQNCKLLLVEADSPSYLNLLTAVDTAVRLGATVVSGSWGGAEFATETNYDSHFNKPGVLFSFSAGDSGYGVSYPASSRYVTAIGGTSLHLNADNTWAGETAWSGTGSGCSLYEAKPAWQHDAGCAHRTTADVAAVADPATGLAVYSSANYAGTRGWFVVGGTSVGAPLVAGLYALAGAVPAGATGAQLPYTRATTANLHDITAGANGACAPAYLCTATTGYDGPTGLGTPAGLSAF